jgi:hypothetical protein
MMGISEREEWAKRLLEEAMTENTPNLLKKDKLVDSMN